MFRKRVALATILFLGAGAPVWSGEGVPAASRDAAAPSRPSPRAVEEEEALAVSILGLYVSDRAPDSHVDVTSLGRGIVAVKSGSRWEAVGFWDGKEFRGVVRSAHRSAYGRAPLGTLGFRMVGAGALAADVDLDGSITQERWTRAGRASPAEPSEPSGPSSPRFGEYVYVEELPEVVTKVQPVYPPEAREADVDGTVLLQVLVGQDGRVHDVRVTKSIPPLDAAAIASVRQWIFKPALAKGKPVAVWVALPVRFTLH